MQATTLQAQRTNPNTLHSKVKLKQTQYFISGYFLWNQVLTESLHSHNFFKKKQKILIVIFIITVYISK